MDVFAERLLKLLEIGRRDGSITPVDPITADEICRRWNVKYPDAIKSEADVRRAVNLLRTKSGALIGSSSQEPMGYCLCYSAFEYQNMNKHILERIRKMSKAYWNPLKKLEQEGTGNLFEEVVDETAKP